MFSGIIQFKKPIKSLIHQGRNLLVTINRPPELKLKAGDSISVNGICSTIVKVMPRDFLVQYIPATLKLVKPFKKGQMVNLETSLKLNDFVSGHLVSGHVDATGEIIKIIKQGNSKTIYIAYPRKFRKYIAPKGSVAINGVSFTINAIKNGYFAISLIPYTLNHTNLGKLKVGERVNIEFDLIAKYIQQCLKKK